MESQLEERLIFPLPQFPLPITKKNFPVLYISRVSLANRSYLLESREKEGHVFPDKKLETEIRDGRIRTYDFLLPKQTRYQAALHPVYELYGK